MPQTQQELNQEETLRKGLEVLGFNVSNVARYIEEITDQGLTPPSLSEIETAAVDYSSSGPRSITMRQARLQLLTMGLLDDVNAAVQSLSPAAQIEWEYATQVNRGSDFVAQMAALLEMTESDLDDFFVEAAQL